MIELFHNSALRQDLWDRDVTAEPVLSDTLDGVEPPGVFLANEDHFAETSAASEADLFKILYAKLAPAAGRRYSIMHIYLCTQLEIE